MGSSIKTQEVRCKKPPRPPKVSEHLLPSSQLLNRLLRTPLQPKEKSQESDLPCINLFNGNPGLSLQSIAVGKRRAAVTKGEGHWPANDHSSHTQAAPIEVPMPLPVSFDLSLLETGSHSKPPKCWNPRHKVPQPTFTDLKKKLFAFHLGSQYVVMDGLPLPLKRW